MYTITNTKQSKKAIVNITIDINYESNIQNIKSSLGWDVSYGQKMGMTHEIAVFPHTAETYLHPGSTMQVLSFDSPLAPAKQPYMVVGDYDEENPGYHLSNAPLNKGLVLSPGRVISSVPESTSCSTFQPASQ